MENEERGLVLAEVVSLPIPVEKAVEQWEQYQELCERLLNETDYQQIGKKRFRKKSGWRKLARAFNITDSVLEKDALRDTDGRVVEASFSVRATAPNGRTADGWGACSLWERAHEEDKVDGYGKVTCPGPCNGRKHFSNPDHDIPATAHTRAKNRAIADLIGAGEVSADEVSPGGAVETTSRVVRDDMPPETPPIADPGSVIITFGKHTDKTIAEVWDAEKGRDTTWLHWVKGVRDYRNPAVRQAAIQFLASHDETLQEEADVIQQDFQRGTGRDEPPPLDDDDFVS